MKRKLLDIYEISYLRFGHTRWKRILTVLGWEGNFISGYRMYDQVFPLEGKAYFPADGDRILQYLHDSNFISPVKFALDPKRRVVVHSMGYNDRHLSKLKESTDPVAGHYIDFDWLVLCEPSKLLANLRMREKKDKKKKKKWKKKLLKIRTEKELALAAEEAEIREQMARLQTVRNRTL